MRIKTLVIICCLLFSPFALAKDRMIDINTATLEQLTQLKGVSKKRAQQIVDYREKHGKFTSIDALLNIKGIGPKFIDNNRAKLQVAPPDK